MKDICFWTESDKEEGEGYVKGQSDIRILKRISKVVFLIILVFVSSLTIIVNVKGASGVDASVSTNPNDVTNVSGSNINEVILPPAIKDSATNGAVISGAGANLLGKVEATGVRALVANASSWENANSPLIDVETFPNSSNVAIGNVEEVRIAEHKITQSELEELKSRVGVYVEERNYNQLVGGYGTGLRPPTDDEWAKIAESAYVVDNVSYQSSPPSVDQSAKPWFPPIGNQDGEGSCTAWAVGYYVKTFQEAKEHAWNFSGAAWEGGYSGHPTLSYQNRIISPDFIYHLINNGVDSGSSFYGAIQLVCFIGACSWEKMPYNPADHTTWPSEEAWTEAPLYRGNSSGYQYMNVNTDLGLANLKNWIASDHLAVIGVDASKYSGLTSADMWTLDNYVNPSVNHANTIVGYDDNVAYTENGQTRYGAFKVANSWGVGGWENVNDGFYWISYEAMKQRVGYCMFYYDLVGYKPELAATFRISHEKRNECDITVGLGNPSAPTITKSFSQYIFGGSIPFCSNNILFDITEFKNYVPTIYNQLYFLKVYDEGSSTVGSISKFAVEYADSMDTPRQTVNGNYIYLNVTLPLLETTWTDERLVNLDQDSVDQKIAMATDSSGNVYVAYADRGSLNLTEIFVRKSSDGGVTWPFLVGVWDYHNLGYPSIAIDSYNNEIYVAFEREWVSNDHDVFVLRFVNGTWSLSSVANIAGEDDRFPSITCEYQYGSGNWQYISYEYVYNNDDRDLMFAKSTDHGATWAVTKLHGDWPDYNVHAQTSITNAEGNIYIAYKWGADYDSLCEIRVERSTDFGGTWTQFSDVDGLPNDCQFPSIAATHGGDAVVVGFQYKWSASDIDIWYSYSTNKGSTWTKGQALFTSGLEDEKSLALVVDGEGTQTQDVRGYIHAVCKVGRYAKYRATTYSQPTNWSTPKTISDGWIGKGLAITVRSVNDTYYPNAAWTDARTKNIYSSAVSSIIPLRFDFGTESSSIEPSYTQVSPSTTYSTLRGYGWDTATGLGSRDRGTPDNLRRDFIFSSSDHTFNVDLANGYYNVTLVIGDNGFAHDLIDIYAEGVLEVNHLTVGAGTFSTQTFNVTANDDQLNLKFHDAGGTDVNWVINAITIQAYRMATIRAISDVPENELGDPATMPDVRGTTFKVAVVVEDVADLYGFEVQFNWTTEWIHYTGYSVYVPVDAYPDPIPPSPYAGILHQPYILIKNVVNETANIPYAQPGTMAWICYVSFSDADPFHGSGTIAVFDFELLNQPSDYEDPDGVDLTTHFVKTDLASSAGEPITHAVRDLTIKLWPRQHTTKKFDFGTASSPVQPGYIQVTASTAYSPSLGYGWTTTDNLESRDRLSPDNIRRDLVFSSMDRTFRVDLPNGTYLVMVIMGDQHFLHDSIFIYVEGTLKVTVSTKAGEFVQKVFVVSVADGTLDLMLQDDGGSDSNWVINAVLIQQYTERKFDFGSGTSPVEPGYTQVLPSTSYSESTSFGWADTADLYARDRGAPDSLRRDLVFSSSNKTFKIDLPNGKYMVVIIIGDNSYGHDLIDIYCEGTLVVNDLTVEKGSFAEVTFLVEVSDDQLEIMFCNDEGTDPNWVVNSIHVKTTFNLRLEFDFGTASSPVEDGYVRVTPATTYSPSTSYGWSDATSLWSRDRGAPDELRRDFVFSSSDRTFNVDLPNGQYQVTLVIGDQNYMHDNIDVYAEDILVVDGLTAPAGMFIEVSFTAAVNDGQLNITFHDNGGSDVNWVINALVIDWND